MSAAAAGARCDELLGGQSRAAPHVAIADLTLDTRAVGAGRRLPRARRAAGRTASSSRAKRVARGARVVLWDPAEGVAPPAPTPTCRSSRCRDLRRPARRHRRPLLRRALGAAHRRRRHRHQRQDHLRLAARLRRCYAPRASRRLPRHARRRLPAGGRGAARSRRRTSVTLQRQLRALARRRRDARGDGSVLARARPGALRRRAHAHRGVHQPEPRSSRLPRRRWSATPQRRRGCSGCPALEHAVINVGDPVGARFAARAAARRRADGDRRRRRRARAPRASSHVGRVSAAERGLELEIRGAFRRAAPALAR